MARHLTTFLLCFVLYLVFTAGSGSIGIWSGTELVAGVVLSALAAALAGPFIPAGWVSMLSPRRFATFVVYLAGPLLFAMAKANLDVAYRVITGRINPGIVKIAPGLRSDGSVTLLANSITLTPGTLSVDVDERTNDLYIHWINVIPEALPQLPADFRPVCGRFPVWAARIAG